TFDTEGNKYLFYKKTLKIWDKEGQLTDDIAIGTIDSLSGDCDVYTQFDANQQLIFSVNKRLYQLRTNTSHSNTCSGSLPLIKSKSSDKIIVEHCFNGLLGSESTRLRGNFFLMTPEGSIWWNRYPNGLVHFDPNTPERLDPYPSEKVDDYQRSGFLFRDQSEVIWKTGYGQLTKLSAPIPNHTFYPTPGRGEIKAVTEAPNGRIYAMIANDIYELDTKTNQFVLFVENIKLQDHLLATADGFWLSSGMYIDYATKTLQSVKGAIDVSTLDDSMVGLFTDGEGSEYATRGGKAVSMVGPSLYRVVLPTFDDRMVMDAQQNIWRANDDNIQLLDITKGIEQGWKVMTDYPASEKGAIDLEVFYYAPKGHQLWMGGKEGNLWSYDIASQTMRQHDSLEEKILTIHEMSNGNIWIGTEGTLLQLDADLTLLKAYKKEDGLFEDLGPFLVEGDSVLWLNVERGLLRFHLATETVEGYGEKEGIPLDLKIGWPLSKGSGIYAMEQNNGSGACTIDFKALGKSVKERYRNPQLVASFIEYMDDEQGQIYSYTTINNIPEFHFEAHETLLKMEYAATDYTQSNSIQYSYRLKGLDDRWSIPSPFNFTRFTTLPSGQYDFQVKAQTESGIAYANQLNVKLVIQPPWWRTTEAYLLYSILLAGLIYLLFAFFKRRLQLQNELKRQEEEAERLKELDSFKSKLYTNLTHEFRTPLTVILGMAEKVRSEPRNFLEEGTHLIERNGKNLLRLINQLLDMSKLENQSFQLQLQQGDIIPYLQYITESFHSYANGKNLALRFFSAEESVLMDFDTEQIKQVMTNLISNAIKFTPSGGEVKVRIIKEGTDLQIDVKDNGIGIPQAALPHIFERFYQVDDSSVRAYEGTGIGLTHSNELVKLMEGQLTVQSISSRDQPKQKSGSTFRIRIPIRNDAPTMADIPVETILPVVPQTQPSMANPIQAQPSILIIEDNPDVVIYLKTCLEKFYQLEIAYNGTIGIEIAIETIPDLIISDVMMPGKDGFEVCNTLKTDERTSHIPVILLTAKADLSSKLAGLERGADAYLTKPFHPDELSIRLQKLLEGRRRMQDYFINHYLQSFPNTSAPTTDTHSKDTQIEDAFIQKVNAILEENIADEDFGLIQLRHKIRMTRSPFFRKMKALTNTTPSDYIRSYRLRKARYLLEHTDSNVAEVAYAVGFKSPSYFARVFHEAYGQTPSSIKPG
ncbi:MAG: ATP-binding protein, partial [Bacteroidota bacterium]